MKMNKNLVASLAVASTIGFFTPLTSLAFGLGNLELKSALNEPFKAEIDVTALKPGERDDLQVQMASNAEFNKAGLERSLLLSRLQFEIVEQKGQVKILVSSKDPVKEPFLDFLLTATAGQGKLLREYTVLLDPPKYVMAEIKSSKQAATTAVVEPAPAKEATVSSYQYPSTSSDSYKVKRSDTLWNIAQETRPQSSISVNQMMMALVKANPDAFTNQNINGLKAGYTLQIPSADEANVLSTAQAIAAVKSQNQAWKNRNKPVSTTANSTTTEVAVVKETAKTTAAETSDSNMTADETAEAEAAPATNQEDAKLKLVAPEDVKTTNQDAAASSLGSTDVEKLSEQLTLAQETIEAQNQENIDFKMRMDALQEQVDTLTRMLSIRDADLARLQDMLEDKNPELAAQLQQQPAATIGDESTATAATQENSQQAETVIDDASAPETTSTPEPMETAEPSMVDTVAETLGLDKTEANSLLQQAQQFASANKLELGIGLALFLVLALVLRRRKKEVTWNEAVGSADKETAEITDAPLQSAAIVMEQDEPSISVEPAPTKVSRGKTAAELIEQADMFVGYADYIQARTSLEQAYNQEPENTLVASKLLFVLYKQGQKDAFLDLLDESPINSGSDEWEEVRQWGVALDPDNSLFAEPEVTATPVAQAEPMDAEQTEFVKELVDQVELSNEPDTDETAHIAFDLNDFATDTVASSSDDIAEVEEEQPLNFNANYSLNDKVETNDVESLSIDSLDLDEPEVDDSDALDVSNNADAEDDNLLSFDIDTADTKTTDDDLAEFSLDISETAEDDTNLDFDLPETEIEAEADNEDMAFDLGDFEDIDETETKLDLAAAYVDMGDPEGAKSILNEVLVEGNEDQKNRAHTLLDSLS